MEAGNCKNSRSCPVLVIVIDGMGTAITITNYELEHKQERMRSNPDALASLALGRSIGLGGIPRGGFDICMG